MPKKLIAATLAGTVFTASAGAAWSQDDARFIFRYRAGLLKSASYPGDGSVGGGQEEPGGPPSYTEIGLGNGWHLYCPARPGLPPSTLAGLIGKSISLYVDEDTIYTVPNGERPGGVLIYYDPTRLPDAYGFEAHLDPAAFGCADEWGGVAVLPGWGLPQRDALVGHLSGGAVVSETVVRRDFQQPPPR